MVRNGDEEYSEGDERALVVARCVNHPQPSPTLDPNFSPQPMERSFSSVYEATRTPIAFY